MSRATERPRGRRLVVVAAALVLTVCFAVGWLNRGGHVVPAELASNHDVDFDFNSPPCIPAARHAADDGDVWLRYLGVGGLYVEWRGAALMTAPFFSSYGLLQAACGEVAPDDDAIARGLAGLPLEQVRAVFAGHSHYDHLADLPPILRDHVPQAIALVNRSGARMLAAFPWLAARTIELEARQDTWIEFGDPAAGPLLRLKPLASGHADHLPGYHYRPGEVTEPWTSWDGARLGQMREGRTFAALIDLLDADGTVAFRIHYQDAASDAPEGFPAAADLAERDVDLAVVCAPSSWLARDYPGALLRHTRARHALVGHYENFFRPREPPLRFVPLLTDRRLARFLGQVRDAVTDSATAPTGPRPCTCGPCGAAWSMPLPGEWLRFPRAC